MDAPVSLLIGIGGGFQQSQTHDTLMDVMAVLAVVEHCHTITVLGKVAVLMSANLELSRIPAGVGVGGPFQGAELDFVSSPVGVDLHREGNLGHELILLPVNDSLEVDLLHILVHPDVLFHRGLQEPAANLVACPGTVADRLDGGDIIHSIAALAVVVGDFPGIPVTGVVFVDLQLVTGALGGVDDFPVGILIIDGDHVEILVEGDLQELVFHGMVAQNNRAFHSLGGDHSIALGGDVLNKAGLAVDFDCCGARERMGVEHQHAALGLHIGCDGIDSGIGNLPGSGEDLGIGLVTFLINLTDGRAGDNIVELEQQNGLPSVVQLLLGIFTLQQHIVHRGHELSELVSLLALAVVALVLGDGGVGAAVQLQVQLAAPDGQVGIVFSQGRNMIQELAGGADPGIGQRAEAVLHTAAQFQHFGSGAAATVTVAEGVDDLVGEFFLLESIPGTGNHRGGGVGIVGGEVLRLAAQMFFLGGEEVAEDLSTVQTPPTEHIVGHGVGLVPADLRGNETINAGLLQNLGQSSGVAEYIGQPQHLALHTEFLLEEPFAEENLANQGFAGGQIAVCLDPHGAFHFPAAGGNHLLHFLIGLGAFFLQIFVQLGLGGHELIFGVLLHQAQNGREGTLGLFTGLSQGPQPCHVDVSVADADDRNILVGGILLVQFLLQIFVGDLQRGVEFATVRLAAIHQIDGLVQNPQNISVGLGDGLLQLQRLIGNLHIVIQFLAVGLHQTQLCVEFGEGTLQAGVGVQIQVEFLHTFQVQLGVVHVHTLGQNAVDIGNELGIPGIPAGFLAGNHGETDIFAPPVLRHHNVGAEPGMAVRLLAPAVIGAKIPESSAVLVGNDIVGLIAALAETPVIDALCLGVDMLLQQGGHLSDAIHGKIHIG